MVMAQHPPPQTVQRIPQGSVNWKAAIILLIPVLKEKSLNLFKMISNSGRRKAIPTKHVLPLFQAGAPHLSQYPLLLSAPETKAAIFPRNSLSFISITFPTTDPHAGKNDDL